MKYPTDFSNWTTQMAHDAFGLKAVETLPSLKEWENGVAIISAYDRQKLADLLTYAKPRVSFWSEGDIKLKLLGPMLVIANIDNSEFSTFSETLIKAHIETVQDGKITVAGRPDLMVATGEFEAKLPYFCMQEYKPKKRGSDPRGQTLVALMATQELNKMEKKPQKVLYGAFSIGRDWTFMTLEGNEYALSKGYFLDQQQDIEDVVKGFRVLKDLISKSMNE